MTHMFEEQGQRTLSEGVCEKRSVTEVWKQKSLLQQRTRSRSGGKTTWYILTKATENKPEIRRRAAWYISKEATENKARNSWCNTWKIKDHQGSSSDSRIYGNSKG